jgi:hypothetical protein
MPDDNYLRYFDATSVPVVAWIGADFQTMEIQEGLPVEFVIYRDGDEIPRYRTPRD